MTTLRTNRTPTKAVVQNPSGRITADFGNLSQREEQVLSYAAAGYIDKQIGAQLGVSVNTLRTYWQRIRSKIGEAPRSALAAAYVTHIAKIAEPPLKDEFIPDWEVDLVTNRFNILSDKPHPQRYLNGADLEDVIGTYVPEDQPGLRRLIRALRAGEYDSIFLKGRFTTPDGPNVASAYIHVLRDQSNKPTKLLGKRVSVVDVTAEPEPSHDWELDIATDIVKRTSNKFMPHPVGVGDSIPLEDIILNYHPDDQPKLRTLMVCAKRGQLDSFTFGGRVVTESGLVPTGGYVYTDRDLNGKPYRLVGKRALSFNLSGESGMVIAAGSFSRDFSTEVIQIDPNLREMFHISDRDGDLIAAIASRIQPEQVSNFKSTMKRALQAKVDRAAATYRVIGNDGPDFWIRVELKLAITENRPTVLNGKIIAFN